MIDNDYLSQLPRNELLAANKICTDFLNGNLKKESPQDTAYLLTVLLEGKLPEGWDTAHDGSETSGFGFLFGKKAPTRPEQQIRRIHRHVKALSAREVIAEPTLINRFLIKISQEDTKRIGELLSAARTALRDSEIKDKARKLGLLKAVDVLQAEVEREHTDFRVLLDSMSLFIDLAGSAGDQVQPAFEKVRQGFRIADARRKVMERVQSPQAVTALPSPDDSEASKKAS